MKNMSNYIIRIDQNGAPYLEHAWGKKTSHKYIARIGEGAKARYFYTQEQLRAFMQGAKNTGKKVKEVAKEKSGINAKQRLEQAKKNNARTQKAANRMIDSGVKTLIKANWEKDSNKSDKLFNEGLKRRNAGFKLQDKSRENLNKAQKAFDKTPLGKAQKIKDFSDSVAVDIDLALWDAGKKAKIVGKKVSDIADDISFEIGYAGEKAVQSITGAKAKKSRDKALEDEKRFRKDAEYGPEGQKWLNEYYADNAKEYAEEMDRKYKKSLSGKLESTTDRMKEEFKKKQKEREDKKQKYSDGTVEETVIKENIIPETIIKEEKISEKVLKDASDHKESNAEKEYNRVKTLKDENKQRMDKILEEQDKIRPEINKYFDKYTDAIEKYGRGSEQAKIAEEKYLDKARPYAKLEQEWQSRRKFNINYSDALEILEEAKKHG